MSENWIDVASADDVREGEVTSVAAAGREIALYCVEGSLYATDNMCTHGQARLCDGFLEGHEIECPLHQGKFDVRTGQVVCAPVTEHIRTYPVKAVQRRVLVVVDLCAASD